MTSSLLQIYCWWRLLHDTGLLRRGQAALRLPQSGRFSGWTRHRSPRVSPAVFLAHPPDLQPWPLMDMDFATSCPLVRPYLPRIRLLFVGSRFRSTLPSDGPSRFRPCASLVLHLHQVAQGTFTPRLPDMPGTQETAPGGGVAPQLSRDRRGRSSKPACNRLHGAALRTQERDLLSLRKRKIPAGERLG